MIQRQPEYDVVVVGGSGVDTIVRVDALPVPLADSVMVGPIEEWPGQTGGNVALGARALGLDVALLDCIGDDPTGVRVRERLAEGDVEFHPLISAAGTRRAVNLVDAKGRRMSFYDARDPEDLRMPQDFYLPRLRRTRHVHLSITNFTRFLYDDIEALGVPVSTDLHDWDGRDEHQREFALRSDLVFFSAATAGDRTPALMRQILREGRAETVVATAGAEGSYLLTRDGGPDPHHVPATVPPAPVVDTNGAGDAFVTGFLYGRLDGRDVRDCARLGAVAGAYACTAPGSTALIGREALLAADGSGSQEHGS
ncbi:carbohydrate kinase family protein [Streptomyces sp. NBC_01260]|uniref:carbohydrate kinase family protein n=1 Tax=Streptomyces sp. ADI92-24 TaxID=1522756 RepID=UPI000F4828EF|nr:MULTISPECIES: carbohydrate kinase family protein [unclassified Streptomyces]ROQ77911.1 sugar/nucleoside kinase (ribokinase family) [Streptomyces sp. CEV 2-1]RPK38491.1 Fructosamine kinase FrlD [Streptomyces sp. ADI92-24]